MQGTRMSFRTKEDAIHFAEKQGTSVPLPTLFELVLIAAFLIGWDYYVYALCRLPSTRPAKDRMSDSMKLITETTYRFFTKVQSEEQEPCS